MNLLTSEPKLERIFNEEIIYELVEDYFIEANEDGEAKLTVLPNKQLFLQTMDVNRAEGYRTVCSFLFPDSQELYDRMDALYRTTIKKGNYNDFWDMWDSLLNIIDPEFLLSRESFEV